VPRSLCPDQHRFQPLKLSQAQTDFATSSHGEWSFHCRILNNVKLPAEQIGRFNTEYRGLQLNGTRYKVSFRVYDDHADPDLIEPLYLYLRDVDKVDVFIAPFADELVRYALSQFCLHRRSLLTLYCYSVAAPLLDSWQVPWMNIGASSDGLFQRSMTSRTLSILVEVALLLETVFFLVFWLSAMFDMLVPPC
jgi:hypothetical protein